MAPGEFRKRRALFLFCLTVASKRYRIDSGQSLKGINLMRFILDLIKGIFVGVANIIPGVSGGTMAVSMGIYDRLIGAIGNLTKEFKKSFLTLLPIAIGMVAGIGIFSFIIPYCLTNFAFQTCMCFTGLIIGGIPEIIGKTDEALKNEHKRIGPAHIIAFLLLLAVAVWMALSNAESVGADSINVGALMIVKLILLGIITSATMVIPGISGSLILMMLGYYSGIVGTVRNLITALKDLNGDALLHCILVLVPFAVGCILGILLISKLISWLLKKFESITYFAILGLITASPFAIFWKMESHTFTPVSIVIGIILLAAGAAFTYLFGKKTKENK